MLLPLTLLRVSIKTRLGVLHERARQKFGQIGTLSLKLVKGSDDWPNVQLVELGITIISEHSCNHSEL